MQEPLSVLYCSNPEMVLPQDCKLDHLLGLHYNRTSHSATCYEIRSASKISNLAEYSPPIIPDGKIVGLPFKSHLCVVVLSDQVEQVVE
jgi:hypothetical protein